MYFGGLILRIQILSLLLYRSLCNVTLLIFSRDGSIFPPVVSGPPWWFVWKNRIWQKYYETWRWGFCSITFPLLEHCPEPLHKGAGLVLEDEQLGGGKPRILSMWRNLSWTFNPLSLLVNAATRVCPEETIRGASWPTHRKKIRNYFKPRSVGVCYPPTSHHLHCCHFDWNHQPELPQ